MICAQLQLFAVLGNGASNYIYMCSMANLTMQPCLLVNSRDPVVTDTCLRCPSLRLMTAVKLVGHPYTQHAVHLAIDLVLHLQSEA